MSNTLSRADLLALPVRAWDAVTVYDSIAILSTRQKHDSGYAVMAIIGCRNGLPIEIAAQCCDDIEWCAPPMLGAGYTIGQMRTDCWLKSGAIHAWSRVNRFRVGAALSSMTVELVPA